MVLPNLQDPQKLVLQLLNRRYTLQSLLDYKQKMMMEIKQSATVKVDIQD
jgi:hypothetical protein